MKSSLKGIIHEEVMKQQEIFLLGFFLEENLEGLLAVPRREEVTTHGILEPLLGIQEFSN